MKALIFPLAFLGSLLYGAGVILRTWLYRLRLLPAYHLPCRVISIGNLVAGGTGKTPHVALLAGRLQKKGIKTAVLSRGYRGREMKAGAVISDDQAVIGSLPDGGEEPFWLARHLPGVPVLVGKDRLRSGRLCVKRWQTEWVLLDDGFQYLRLERTVNLLLLTVKAPFGPGGLLPLGTLREPIHHLRRADLILITHAEAAGPLEKKDLLKRIRKISPEVPVFFSDHWPARLWNLADRTPRPLSWLQGKKVLAFCGLAQPDSFAFSLRQLKSEIVHLAVFPDHYAYDQKDKEKLANLARSLKPDLLITTEKDALKIEGWNPEQELVLVLGIEIQIQEPAFWDLLDRKIADSPNVA